MKSAVNKWVAISWLAALPCLATSPLAAQEASNADVYVTVTELLDEAELIREVMGRPFDDSPRLPLSGITEFELYMQTETLLLRANRLASELAGSAPVFPPPVPDGDVSPADILALAERALDEIRLVRAELGVTEEVAREQRSTPIAPTGVFSVVLDTNRQLNLLLDNEFDSADVHGRLVVAATLAAGILDELGAVSPPPSRSPGPRWPFHVVRNLLDCLDLATGIGSMTGVETMTVSARRNVPVEVTPGHAYDVAQFLVADLTMIARRLGAKPVETDLGPVPQHIFPVHTNALAEHVRRQLEAISAAL